MPSANGLLTNCLIRPLKARRGDSEVELRNTTYAHIRLMQVDAPIARTMAMPASPRLYLDCIFAFTRLYFKGALSLLQVRYIPISSPRRPSWPIRLLCRKKESTPSRSTAERSGLKIATAATVEFVSHRLIWAISYLGSREHWSS